MFQMFYPDEYADSAYSIDYQNLYLQGYRAVLFDIDNTLVPHGADATPEAIYLFKKLKEMGYQTCLISNNKEPRVQRFNRDIKTLYIYKAGKPSTKNYLRAMEQMGIRKEQTIFVGDQLFTDVYGAKRAGIRNYLVKPIDPKEEIQIVLKRFLEKIILYFYKRRHKQ